MNEHRHLQPFVGRWKTEGRIRATETEPERTLSGTDTYEWLDGGFFLVHHVDVRMGDEPATSIEIIGYDPARGRYPMHFFDNHGTSGVMYATVDGRTWHFTGDAMRFTGTFSADGGTMEGLWEQRGDDGEWRAWMDVRLTRT